MSHLKWMGPGITLDSGPVIIHVQSAAGAYRELSFLSTGYLVCR
jgi:hypothetical protein